MTSSFSCAYCIRTQQSTHSKMHTLVHNGLLNCVGASSQRSILRFTTLHCGYSFVHNGLLICFATHYSLLSAHLLVLLLTVGTSSSFATHYPALWVHPRIQRSVSTSSSNSITKEMIWCRVVRVLWCSQDYYFKIVVLNTELMCIAQDLPVIYMKQKQNQAPPRGASKKLIF